MKIDQKRNHRFRVPLPTAALRYSPKPLIELATLEYTSTPPHPFLFIFILIVVIWIRLPAFQFIPMRTNIPPITTITMHKPKPHVSHRQHISTNLSPKSAQRILRSVKAEGGYLRDHDKTCAKSKARSEAIRYDHTLEERYQESPQFWKPWRDSRSEVVRVEKLAGLRGVPGLGSSADNKVSQKTGNERLKQQTIL
jgi:hypothetical protein